MLTVFALILSLNVAVRIPASWNYIFQEWLILFLHFFFLKIPFSGFVATDWLARDEPNVTGLINV